MGVGIVSDAQLLFSTPMIRAILEGRKTQARLIVAPQPATNKAGKPYRLTSHNTPQSIGVNACPYGKSGHLLWVREAFTSLGLAGAEAYYKATLLDDALPLEPTTERDSRDPLSFSLKITNVRIERLQNITPEECIAEGYQPTVPVYGEHDKTSALVWYRAQWESEYGAGTWTDNPWVWVILFDFETWIRPTDRP